MVYMRKEIVLMGKVYSYELERKNVKNLNLRINTDSSIYISAPKALPVYKIEGFLHENEVKIQKLILNHEAASERSPMPVEFSDGEEFLYLGERQKIRIIKADRNFAQLKEDALYLMVKEPQNTELKKKLFKAFIKAETRKILLKICREYYPAFCPPLTEFPQIRFRKMSSRWGSCTPGKNLLCFASCLSCLPVECIEYVAAHEFTHFIWQNHSRSFYRELESFMPDRRAREQLLRQFNQIPRKF